MALISHGGGNRVLAAGKTIFDYADELAVQVPTSCGRTGQCHECVVEVKRGMEALCPRTEPESFLRGDYRLACQAMIRNADCDVEFALLRRRPQILTSTAEKPLNLDPLVTRVENAVFYDGQRMDTYRGHLYGVAIDLGTTTVVMELVNLETGASLCMSSFDNPQRFGGSDVMNRISYDSGKFRGELHKAIMSAVNHELQQMCRDLHFSRQEIYEVVVAGNSTMRDLFFNLDVQSIGQRPYKSVVEHEYRAGLRETTALVEKAHKLGILAHPHARIFGAPL